MTAGPVVALAGGVGAARYLRGVARAVPHDRLTVIGNTGDDRRFYGVHVSPDLDIVTYTLAERIDRERGYGLEGDTHRIVDTLARYGHETWFRLGDEDLANGLHRTLRLADGAGLAEITAEIARVQGLAIRILPMSRGPVPDAHRAERRPPDPLRGVPRPRRRARRGRGRRTCPPPRRRHRLRACSTRSPARR